MTTITNTLRQAFTPNLEYDNLRHEDTTLTKLQKHALTTSLVLITLLIVVSTIVSLKIVFPSDNLRRPFCAADRRVGDDDGDIGFGHHAFYLTDQETVDYYWVVVFVPSTVVFVVSVVYLVAGILVAYSAPKRHGCLAVVENNYCASRRGGVRCLAIMNIIFVVIFGLLAIVLGSSILTLGSSCALPLFWCYEISSWGMVILFGGTACFLRRRAAVIFDELDLSARNIGLEMLEATPMEVTPDVERRVNEGFKSWMGSSLLSSDDEDESDSYQEVPHPISSITIQRV